MWEVVTACGLVNMSRCFGETDVLISVGGRGARFV